MSASLLSALAAWFSIPSEDGRSALQLEREQYLLWHPGTGSYRRWMAVLPAVLAQLCLGSFYSTSVFNRWADTRVWHVPGSNAGGFTACVAVYGLGTVFLGNWIGREGVFSSVRFAVVLMPLGWVLASVALRTSQLWLLYFGYGVCHGLSCALCYISTTSCLTGWYPEYKGFVSGLAVFGAGLGSFVWTSIGRLLMDPAGPYKLDPPAVQLVFAACFFCILVTILPLLRNAPPGFMPPQQQAAHPATVKVISATAPDRAYTFLEAVRQQEFALLAILVLGTSISGAVFLSSASDMVMNLFGYDTTYAALVTSYLNAVNFTGRFAWGFATDKIGRKSFFLLSAATQTIALVLMMVAIRSRAFTLWLVCFLLIGSLYGGLFGVLPATLVDLFGSRISSATHGALIGVWAFGVVCGVPIFGAVTARLSFMNAAGVQTPLPEAYIVNAEWLAAFPASALVAALFLTLKTEDRKLRKGAAEAAGQGAFACVVSLPSSRKLLFTVKALTVNGSGAALLAPSTSGNAQVVGEAIDETDEAWSAKGAVAYPGSPAAST